MKPFKTSHKKSLGPKSNFQSKQFSPKNHLETFQITNYPEENIFLKLLRKMLHQPILIGTLFILFIILLIPTAIVHFVAKDETVVLEENLPEEEPTTPADDHQTESVGVQRSDSEEIEDVTMETYVARVVASEMPAKFNEEALKAQSLAARTYVIHYMLHQQSDESLNISDQEEHQVYNNDKELRQQLGDDYQWKMDKITQAVNATAGEVLTYEGELITPVYFSTSNGYTENSEEYWQTEIPYLRSVKSPWDEASPKFKEQFTFTLPEVEAALGVNLQSGSVQPTDITKTTGERVKQLSLNGTSFTGREIREKLNLPSSDFSIEQKGNYLIFTTRGYGHGVGMSQYGANGMAEEGKTYEEIVAHYYKDVTIDLTDDFSRIFAFEN